MSKLVNREKTTDGGDRLSRDLEANAVQNVDLQCR